MTAFRSRTTLEAWLGEFVELHHPIAGEVRVIEQDGTDGADTGLVGVEFASAATGAYIQPVSIGDERWVVTMDACEEPITLTASALRDLAAEMTTIAALCAFLEDKSTGQARDDQL